MAPKTKTDRRSSVPGVSNRTTVASERPTHAVGRRRAVGAGERLSPVAAGRRRNTNAATVDMQDAAIREALELFDAPVAEGDEAQQRLTKRCEQLVNCHLRSTIVIALALESIHDRGLWKQPGFDSFGDYVAKKWHYSHSRGYQYVDAGQVYRNLVNNCGHLPLPVNEGQVRPMVGETPEMQVEIWTRVVTSKPVAEVTARFVKERVLAVLTEHAVNQPEESTPATQPQGQPDRDDDGHDQHQDDDPDRVQLQLDGEAADREPGVFGDDDEGQDVSEANSGEIAGRLLGRDAFPLSAAGQLLQAYGGEPKPAPTRDTIDQAHAAQAWIYQTPNRQEQERRRRAVEEHGCACWASVGRDIIITTFWAMVWLRVIQETRPGSGMYYMAEQTLTTASGCAATD